MNEAGILSKLNAELTGLVKSEIIRQDLIDTGKLRDTIEVRSSIIGGSIAIEIWAQDYFEHVDNRYGVMETVTRSYQWQNALETAVGDLLEMQIG